MKEEEDQQQSLGNILIANEQIEWHSEALQCSQTRRQIGWPTVTINCLICLFKLIISSEMCDIILRETNQKSKKVCCCKNFPQLPNDYPKENLRHLLNLSLMEYYLLLVFSETIVVVSK